MKKNTLIFWKNIKTGSFGGDLTLRSIGKAKEFADFSNIADRFHTFIPVTLTDEQLKLVTDKNSIEQFNPFALKKKYENEMKLFKSQKEAFAYGLFLSDSKKPAGKKNNSLLKSALAQDSIFDSAVIKRELFSFLAPVNPFKSIKEQLDILIPVAAWHGNEEKKQAWAFFNDKSQGEKIFASLNDIFSTYNSLIKASLHKTQGGRFLVKLEGVDRSNAQLLAANEACQKNLQALVSLREMQWFSR